MGAAAVIAGSPEKVWRKEEIVELCGDVVDDLESLWAEMGLNSSATGAELLDALSNLQGDDDDEPPPPDEEELKQRREEEITSTFDVGGRSLSYGSVCFRGFYPDTPHKANQDSMGVREGDNFAIFGVYDGHGPLGDKCSQHARDSIVGKFESILTSMRGDGEALISDEVLIKTYVQANGDLRRSDVDDSLSGTTAVTVVLKADTLKVANAGDSRAVLFTKEGATSGKGIRSFPLSQDQTPYRKDERERVRKTGAKVMSMDQIMGDSPMHDNWDVKLGEEIDDGGDPPRIWAADLTHPGSAFTRSIGDAVAESLGVIPDPELSQRRLTEDDQILVVASDGVWEFLTNERVLEIVAGASTPQEAANELWETSYKTWLAEEARTDDITVIVVDLAGFFGPHTFPATAIPSSFADKTDDLDVGAPFPTSGKKKKATRRGSTGFEANSSPEMIAASTLAASEAEGGDDPAWMADHGAEAEQEPQPQPQQRKKTRRGSLQSPGGTPGDGGS